jgi:hypothetical protein
LPRIPARIRNLIECVARGAGRLDHRFAGTLGQCHRLAAPLRAGGSRGEKKHGTEHSRS